MSDSQLDHIKASVERLLRTYHELNSDRIDELYDDPSALDFMRYVSMNRPFVLRGGCKSWKASSLWNAQYLRKVVGETEVNVATTPLG